MPSIPWPNFPHTWLTFKWPCIIKFPFALRASGRDACLPKCAGKREGWEFFGIKRRATSQRDSKRHIFSPNYVDRTQQKGKYHCIRQDKPVSLRPTTWSFVRRGGTLVDSALHYVVNRVKLVIDRLTDFCSAEPSVTLSRNAYKLILIKSV